MTGLLHLIKLSVGTEDVADLADWQQQRQAQTADGLPRHVTRMWPRREAEVLGGGSIYWVIKGMVLCRQKVLRLDPVTGEDGIARCAIVLDPALVRVAPVPRQPFQGWRYLKPGDAPPDLGAGKAGDDALPPALSRALAEIGLL
ncbi:MAG: DUF1489 domain-containing protein [Rubellimicrobium sp.]|nr:DUF1489 domain-containing protein [Rubellimicrobium sp.]